MKRYKQWPWWGKVFAGAALLLLFCCACGLFGSLAQDNEEVATTAETEVVAQEIGEEPTASQSTTAELTNTSELTSESAPTVVPTTEPTATSLPTATAIPDPTTAPEPTATVNPEATAEAAYVRMLLSTSDLYATAMEIISEQSIAASEDVSLFFDDEWIVTTATGVFGVKEASRQVLEYEGAVPSRFVEVNREYRAIAQLYDEAMDAYVEGIDNFDSEKINQAITLMVEGNERINDLTEVMAEMDLPTIEAPASP